MPFFFITMILAVNSLIRHISGSVILALNVGRQAGRSLHGNGFETGWTESFVKPRRTRTIDDTRIRRGLQRRMHNESVRSMETRVGKHGTRFSRMRRYSTFRAMPGGADRCSAR